MKKQSIVIHAENPHLNKVGYLSYLNEDKDGHLDYRIYERESPLFQGWDESSVGYGVPIGNRRFRHFKYPIF